jgi:hypothetical protein
MRHPGWPVKEEIPGRNRRYLQVLQDLPEQWEQPVEAALRRLEPPPIPNADSSFRNSGEPHLGHRVSDSRPERMSASNVSPQAQQEYS